MESKAPVEFSYKPSIQNLLLVMIVFGGLALAMETVALTVDHDFYWGGYSFDANQVAIFCSIMVAASAALFVLGFLKLNWSLNGGSKIGLTDNELLVSGFFRGHKIAFNAIREVELVSAKSSWSLRIRTEDDKVDINELWLPKGAFDRIRTSVEQRSNRVARAA